MLSCFYSCISLDVRFFDSVLQYACLYLYLLISSYVCGCAFVHICLHLCVCWCAHSYVRAYWCVPTEQRLCVCILYVCMCMSARAVEVCVTLCACGGASVNGIVSKWQRGSRENDSYVCGLITINSPFDCNWCLNLHSPPPLGRPLVPHVNSVLLIRALFQGISCILINQIRRPVT